MLTVSNSVLQYLQEVRFGEFGHLHALILAHILNPLIGLSLWINDEWPSTAVEDEDTIVDGQTIGWKSILLPITDFNFFGQNTCKLIIV